MNDDAISALDKTYHLDCFQCSHCEEPFRDSLYYERSGVLYCKQDYLLLFGSSVCAGCVNPFVKGDSAMEAMGMVRNRSVVPFFSPFHHV